MKNRRRSSIVYGKICMMMVVGLVAVVGVTGDQSEAEIHTSMKESGSSFCDNTEYKEACQKAIGSLTSKDPKEAVKKAIEAAKSAVTKFFNSTETWVKEAKDGTDTKMALEDCRDLMDLAVDSLQAAFSTVGDPKLHDMSSRINDLRTWLSAVLSYKSSCGDAFEDGDKMKNTVTGDMESSKEFTSNALAIVTKLDNALGKLGLRISALTGHGRKLMEFPEWVSSKDRKLLAGPAPPNPNAVVAKDGSGQFKTIMAALNAAPKKSTARHTIYVKAGVYDEPVVVDKTMTNILMYGDGPAKTVVTGKKNFGIMKIKTQDTATFTAIGNGFIAKSMAFQNTAGPDGHQAVALRVTSDKSVFYDCRMDGFQDTLYVHANRQFYRNCVISGTIDFIFGDAACVIQNSLIVVRKPLANQFTAVTAQGKADKNENTAIVIQGCRIVPEATYVADRLKNKNYLGRPWKDFATTVYINNEIGDLITPPGWFPWEGAAGGDHTATCYYAEFGNTGPGANTAQRVNWPGYKRNFPRQDADKFTVQNLLHSLEPWIFPTGVPFTPGLKV